MKTYVSRLSRRTSVCTATACLLAIGGLASSPHLAASEFEEHLVNKDVAGEEHRQRPQAMPLDDGGSLVLWEDNGRGHIDVLARRFDADLLPAGDPFRINTEEGRFRHTGIDISNVTAGEAVAVWRDERSAPRAIYARRISSEDGNGIGVEFPVNIEYQGGEADDPRAVRDASGRTLVSWIDRVHQKGRVLLQLLDADGNRLGQNFPATDSIEFLQKTGSVDSLPDGRWIVVWSQRDDTADWNIFYRFLNADGSYSSDPVRANTDIFTIEPQIEPDVMVRADDILLIWNDRRQNGVRDVWGRWIDFDGEPLAADFLLREASDPSSDATPRAVLASDGSYAVHWFGGIDNRQRSMVRFFGADREPVTASIAMDDPAAGILFRGRDMLPTADGSWWFFWGHNGTGTYNNYARRFDPATNKGTEVTTLFSSPLSSTQVYGDIALFPDGRAISVWSDLQYGSQAIFGRLLDSAGKPEGDSFQISEIPANAAFTTIDSVVPLWNYSPHVAASADGFVVTWAINKNGGQLRSYAQLFNAHGNPVGDNLCIDATGTTAGFGEDDCPNPNRGARPTMLPGGRFAVAYQLNILDNAGEGQTIYIRFFGADGLPEGSRVRCVDGGSAFVDQLSPAITSSEFGEIMVAWIDKRSGGWDIWAQRFDPSGNKVGVNVIQHGADDTFSDQLAPDISMQSDRNVVVWETRAATLGVIEARLEILPSAQNAGGGDITRIVVNRKSQNKGNKGPQVTLAKDGRFLVTWWDDFDGQTHLFAQRYDAKGVPIGDAYIVHGNGAEGSRLSVRVDATSEIIQFAWSDSRRNKGWDIRARRVDWGFTGAPTPVLLSGWASAETASGLQLAWQTASELGFAGFQVFRQFAAEVPSNRPEPDATRLTKGWVPSEASGSYRFLDTTAPAGKALQYFLEAVDLDGSSSFFGPFEAEFTPPALAFSAGPNPFRNSVHFRVPTSGEYELQILDVTGRQIQRIAGTQAVAGSLVHWDGRSETGQRLPSGIYFARLGTEVKILKLIRIE